MDNNSNFIKRLLLSAVTLVLAAVASAQNITGVVVDSRTGEPIAGVTITTIPEGSPSGATTGLDGTFSLKVSKLPAKLKISFIGYRSLELSVYDDEEPVRVELVEQRNYVDEVVVVGYGTQKAQNLTSAVSSVKATELKDIPVVSAEQALQGRSSGLQLTSPSGNLGTAPIVRVRGVASITSGTSPLYIVDGVPVQSGNLSYAGDTNALADINPDDIESISVLKDASAAALYGSRAANGVILITTKRGVKGRAKVTYSGWVGVSSAVRNYDVLNAQQLVDVKNYAVKNHYGTDEWSLSKSARTTDGTKAFNLAYDKNGKLIDTDWNNYVFRSALQHSHAVSVDGGSEKVTYHISGNYLDQDGIIRGDKFSRYGTTFNVDAKATSWLKVGTNQSIALSNQKSADRSRGGSITAYAGFSRLGWGNFPNIPMYGDDGKPYQESGHLGYYANTVQAPLDNPASIIESGSGVSSENLRWMGSFYAELSPLKGLTIRSQYGRDIARIEDRDFYGPTTVNGFSVGGRATNVSVRSQQQTWSNTASYSFATGKNNFDILLGTEYNKRERKYWGATKTGLVDEAYTIFEASYKNITAVNSAINENALISYFGRINYDWDNRYILSLNVRRDGFSALSENNRWGNFGGVSAAWRISEEKFFEPLKAVVSELKLKGSWGVVGNTNVGDYASKSYYTVRTTEQVVRMSLDRLATQRI